MQCGEIGKICFSRLTEGEDLAESIRKNAETAGIKAGFFMAIGSLKDVAIGYYKEGEYKVTRFQGPLEIASCMGNIAVEKNGEIIVHAHLVVSDEKGLAFGGHLMKDSLVGATAEIVLIEASHVELIRFFDEKTKLKPLRL